MSVSYYEERPVQPEKSHWPAWNQMADHIYCICLQEREDRRQESAKHFESVGLNSLVTYYRPVRDPDGPRKGSWEAHREVCRRARQDGHKHVLIFEDDICFAKTLSNIQIQLWVQKMHQLPKPWDIFFLGHLPLGFSYPVTPDLSIWKVKALMIHAYVVDVNGSWVDWILRHPFTNQRLLLDSYAMKYATSYACYPMFAFQTKSPSTHDRRSLGLWQSLVHYVIENCETTAPLAEKIIYALFFLLCWLLISRVGCLIGKAILPTGTGK